MMSYINETDFVIENKKLVYPEIVTDGLQLYYDAKGKRDTDYHRDTMLDMSGNKNHGKLYNFAYEKHSGYKDGLVFDYIDDKLVRPTLNLKPDDFTFMLNGNIISFSPDGTVKRVQDGEVIESKGFNLIRNGNVESSYTFETASYINFLKTGDIVGPLNYSNNQSTIPAVSGHEYYVRAIFSKGTVRERLYFVYEGNTANFNNGSTSETDKVSGIITANKTGNANLRLYGSAGEKTKQSIMIIDLTETFGAGNEPTKEQMDEIINRFGFIPNSQDLIDRIEYKGNELGDMENIIDGLYKTEVLSGEEIYTDKADDDAVVHVDIDGKSYQHAGSGKNFFNKRMLSDRSKFQLDTYSSSPVIQLKPNTAYVLSASRVNPSPDGNQLVLNVMDATGGVPIYGSQDYNSKRIRSLFNMLPNHVGFNNFTNTFTTTESGLIFFSYYDNHKGKSPEGNWFTDVMIDAQLEEGSVATTYEQPAPTPDYPVEIHSLNDFDVVSSKGKRNLISMKDIRTNGASATSNGQNLLLQNVYGYPTGILAKDVIQAGKTYTMSHKENLVSGEYNNGTAGSIRFYDPYGASPTISTTRTTPVRTFSYEFISDTLELYIYGSNMGTVDFSEIKVEESNAITPYNPSEKDITELSNHLLIDKINLLLYEPLRSVGDVKDRLFRDSDGLWKIERRIWAQVLDKNTTLNSSGAVSYEGTLSTNRYISPTKYILGHSTAMYELCTHLPHKNQVWANDNFILGTSVNGATQFHFRIPNSLTGVIPGDGVLTRSSKINDWLESEKNKGNPFTIQYIMRDPEIEILPQTLQDKLNNLRSFEDSNYVYTVEGSTNLLDTVPLLNNHWYPSSGTLQNPVTQNGHTSTQEPLPVYPGAKIHLTKETTVDNYWRIVWVSKDNNVVIREVSTVNDLVLTAPNGAYGMRVSYPNGSNPVIKFDKSGITQTISDNLKPTIHAKFLYNNWYKEDRVINNLMIYNRALTNEEMLQNYKTIKRRWGM